MYEVIQERCIRFLNQYSGHKFHLSFLDPPFNQNKEYNSHDDNMDDDDYWEWMTKVCRHVFENTVEGGSIYFMQREKNAKEVIQCLNESGWTFQNMVIWRKKTSAVPSNYRFGKHYQIIVFATKGKKPLTFNKLRIDPPLLKNQKFERPNGIYVTDVWDDIRELTSGYFAGDEPLRDENDNRCHKQQSPIKLLTRIILSSSKIGDLVFDPFAGTGTTMVVAEQLQRDSIGVEVDPINYKLICNRLREKREVDYIYSFRDDYKYTENLDEFWPVPNGTEYNNNHEKNNSINI